MQRYYTIGWDDYELLDAGGGKKLERWGKIITIRPEVQAYFKSEWPHKKWLEMAHLEFIQGKGQTGKWKHLKPNVPESWTIQYEQLKFQLNLTQFKHLGLFPEQRLNWDFIMERLPENGRFLNLFAYTGAASLAARSKGAEVIHVDSVKQLITWSKTNMEVSQLEGIKWVHEDALKFALREEKRDSKYDGLIMDPPAFGIGAKGERWKLEEKLPELLKVAKAIVKEGGFIILNTYSPQVTEEFMTPLLAKVFPQSKVDFKELWMDTSTDKEMYCGLLTRITL